MQLEATLLTKTYKKWQLLYHTHKKSGLLQNSNVTQCDKDTGKTEDSIVHRAR